MLEWTDATNSQTNRYKRCRRQTQKRRQVRSVQSLQNAVTGHRIMRRPRATPKGPRTLPRVVSVKERERRRERQDKKRRLWAWRLRANQIRRTFQVVNLIDPTVVSQANNDIDSIHDIDLRKEKFNRQMRKIFKSIYWCKNCQQRKWETRNLPCTHVTNCSDCARHVTRCAICDARIVSYLPYESKDWVG